MGVLMGQSVRRRPATKQLDDLSIRNNDDLITDFPVCIWCAEEACRGDTESGDDSLAGFLLPRLNGADEVAFGELPPTKDFLASWTLKVVDFIGHGVLHWC